MQKRWAGVEVQCFHLVMVLPLGVGELGNVVEHFFFLH